MLRMFRYLSHLSFCLCVLSFCFLLPRSKEVVTYARDSTVRLKALRIGRASQTPIFRLQSSADLARFEGKALLINKRLDA